MQPGPVQRRVDLVSLRYALVTRCGVVSVYAALGVVTAVPDSRSGALPAAAVAGVGAGLFGWLYQARSRPAQGAAAGSLSAAVVGLDLALLAGLCLFWADRVPTEAAVSGASWVLVVAEVAVIAYQWYLGPVAGIAVAAAVTAAYLVGVAGLEVAGTAVWAVWMVAEAVLCQGLRALVRRGAVTADRVLAAEQARRRDDAVLTARRAAERARAATLHDTVAATLLMVGSGTVEAGAPWLPDQARRDLGVLTDGRRSAEETATGSLRAALRQLATESPLTEHGRLRAALEPVDPVDLPTQVQEALVGAVREALTNAWLHAGESALTTLSCRLATGLVVEVADDGIGFEPAAVEPRRRGVRHSILQRCARAGVTVRLESTPGTGTTVRLEWPGG